MGFLANIMMKKALAMFFTVLLGFQVSSTMAAGPTVYRVGDDQGWTAMGAVNYSQWADSKTFHVGDVLRFEYSAAHHNVMQVLLPQYESCNTTAAPLMTYTTGDDSITLKKESDYYFICGIPHHCEAGQKVHVRVVSSSLDAAPPGDSNTSGVTSLSAMSLIPGVQVAMFVAVVAKAFDYYL